MLHHFCILRIGNLAHPILPALVGLGLGTPDMALALGSVQYAAGLGYFEPLVYNFFGFIFWHTL